MTQFESFWIHVSNSIEKEYRRGHPSLWKKEEIDLFLPKVNQRVKIAAESNEEICKLFKLPKDFNGKWIYENGTFTISYDSFRRIFITKETKRGGHRARNIFAIYLGCQSYDDYLNKHQIKISEAENVGVATTELLHSNIPGHSINTYSDLLPPSDKSYGQENKEESENGKYKFSGLINSTSVVFVLLFIIGGMAFISQMKADEKGEDYWSQNVRFNKKDSSSLKIVLLPFKPDIEQCMELDVDYKGQILERLEQKRETENLNISIMSVDYAHCPVTDGQARKIGEDLFDADMVIWGSYEEDHYGIKKVRIRYVLTKEFNVDSERISGDTEIQNLKSLRQLREGYLQRDIDFIIYWIEAMQAFQGFDFKRVGEKLDLAMSAQQNEIFDFETYIDCGRYYMNIGRNPEALTYVQKALDIIKDLPGKSDLLKIAPYQILGSIYREKGHFEQALGYMKQADSLANLSANPNTRDQAILHYELACTYKELGKYQIALQYAQSALKTIDTQPDTFILEKSRISCEIATLYRHLGQLDSALYLYLSVKDIYELKLDDQHPFLAQYYNSIGIVYLALDHFDLALNYTYKALDIRNKVYPADHPYIGSTYNNLAVIYKESEKDTMALSYYLKAKDNYEKSYGSDHPEVAKLYNNMAALYEKMKDFESAIRLNLEALVIYEKVLDPNHPVIAISHHNLGLALTGLGRYNEAITHHAIAVQSGERNKVSHLYQFYCGYAKALYKNKEKEEAYAYQLKCLECLKVSFPDKLERLKLMSRRLELMEKDSVVYF